MDSAPGMLSIMRELTSRREHGITVQLLWEPPSDRVLVSYRDARSDDAFIVEVPRDRGLDAFHHPNAYRPDSRTADPREACRLGDLS